MIHKSAFLEMCICGVHGHFVLSDGTAGAEFCSKSSAKDELNRLKSLRKIELDEFRFLGDQVYECGGLVHDDRDADSLTLHKCEIINNSEASEEGEDTTDDFKKKSASSTIH